MNVYQDVAELEDLALDKEKKFQILKAQVSRALKEGKVTPENINNVIEEAFRLGRYAGHCQGEAHVKKTYFMGIYE